ncbi:hypothetical protein ACFOPN_17425 [Xanthomonas hyacinthi]
MIDFKKGAGKKRGRRKYAVEVDISSGPFDALAPLMSGPFDAWSL